MILIIKLRKNIKIQIIPFGGNPGLPSAVVNPYRDGTLYSTRFSIFLVVFLNVRKNIKKGFEV